MHSDDAARADGAHEAAQDVVIQRGTVGQIGDARIGVARVATSGVAHGGSLPEATLVAMYSSHGVAFESTGTLREGMQLVLPDGGHRIVSIVPPGISADAGKGKVALLLHASDAGEDGNRKLDQALRVGSDAEGSDLKGLVIAASRTILSSALGRENVVHVAVTDPGAARRVGETLSRWHRFIGFGSGEQPCETRSQGSIAAAAPKGAAADAANEGLTTVHE